MQRIEDYKDSLTREQLLQLGDEAASELCAGSDQLLLTEMLMAETVDDRIVRLLKLPSFRKWRSKIRPLREAQRDPTHWQIERSEALAGLLARLEPGDNALVVGNGAEPAVYLLAAHDVDVVCLAEDTPAADRIEDILASESLKRRGTVYVVALAGDWLPPLPTPIHFVVVDARAVLALPPERQHLLLARVQDLTAPEGLHAVIASDPGTAPESCLRHYPDWQRRSLLSDTSAKGKRTGFRGVLLTGPPARAIPQSAYARPAV